MKPEYLSDDLDDMLFHVVEEASEVIKEVTKIKRFGAFNRWPNSEADTNLTRLIQETDDLQKAVRRYAAAQTTQNLTREDWIGDL